MDSIRRAARYLPRLDAVGGSAAGVYISNRVRVGSLYRGVPSKDFAEKIAPLFLRLRDELGVPLEVVNDGEVTALAGSMSIGDNPVLGIALGSSQAGGYVNAQGNIPAGSMSSPSCPSITAPTRRPTSGPATSVAAFNTFHRWRPIV